MIPSSFTLLNFNLRKKVSRFCRIPFQLPRTPRYIRAIPSTRCPSHWFMGGRNQGNCKGLSVPYFPPPPKPAKTPEKFQKIQFRPLVAGTSLSLFLFPFPFPFRARQQPTGAIFFFGGCFGGRGVSTGPFRHIETTEMTQPACF